MIGEIHRGEFLSRLCQRYDAVVQRDVREWEESARRNGRGGVGGMRVREWRMRVREE